MILAVYIVFTSRKYRILAVFAVFSRIMPHFFDRKQKSAPDGSVRAEIVFAFAILKNSVFYNVCAVWIGGRRNFLSVAGLFVVFASGYNGTRTIDFGRSGNIHFAGLLV